jgi:hypothetical protein
MNYSNLDQTLVATVNALGIVDTAAGEAAGTFFRVRIVDAVTGDDVSEGTYDVFGLQDTFADDGTKYAPLDATELGPFLTAFLSNHPFR